MARKINLNAFNPNFGSIPGWATESYKDTLSSLNETVNTLTQAYKDKRKDEQASLLQAAQIAENREKLNIQKENNALSKAKEYITVLDKSFGNDILELEAKEKVLQNLPQSDYASVNDMYTLKTREITKNKNNWIDTKDRFRDTFFEGKSDEELSPLQRTQLNSNVKMYFNDPNTAKNLSQTMIKQQFPNLYDPNKLELNKGYIDQIVEIDAQILAGGNDLSGDDTQQLLQEKDRLLEEIGLREESENDFELNEFDLVDTYSKLSRESPEDVRRQLEDGSLSQEYMQEVINQGGTKDDTDDTEGIGLMEGIQNWIDEQSPGTDKAEGIYGLRAVPLIAKAGLAGLEGAVDSDYVRDTYGLGVFSHLYDKYKSRSDSEESVFNLAGSKMNNKKDIAVNAKEIVKDLKNIKKETISSNPINKKETLKNINQLIKRAERIPASKYAKEAWDEFVNSLGDSTNNTAPIPVKENEPPSFNLPASTYAREVWDEFLDDFNKRPR